MTDKRSCSLSRVAWAALAGMLSYGCGGPAPVTTSCPAPLPSWYSPITGGTVRSHEYEVILDGRTIVFDGRPIEEVDLPKYLSLVRTMTPPPLIHFDPEKGIDCAFATRIRDIVHTEFDCASNKCWHGSRKARRETPLKEDEFILPW